MHGLSDNMDVIAAPAAGPESIFCETGLPFFFGDPAPGLYACLHGPAPDAAHGEPVLICNAAAHEYERCHKAMRQLAIQLARAGSPVLRFDYSGTGDSVGDEYRTSLADWRADIHAAIDELRRRSRQRQVTLMGLRLGATLAVQVAAQRDDVRGLVLYAPVWNARAMLAEWFEAQSLHERAHGTAAAETRGSDVLGYPLTDALQAELHDDLAVPAPSAALRRVLICTADAAGTPDDVAARLTERGATLTVDSADAVEIWRREPMDALVPFKLIRRIVAWHGQGAD